MSEYGLSLEEALDGLTMPQLRLLLQERRRRIAQEKRIDALVAMIPFQKNPGEFMSSLMDVLDVEEGGRPAYEHRETWEPPRSAPLLHELTPRQAQMMRIPIQFVDVEEKAE